jgi:predicted  nucleic acid-binding Zn-ribbon protein
MRNIDAGKPLSEQENSTFDDQHVLLSTLLAKFEQLIREIEETTKQLETQLPHQQANISKTHRSNEIHSKTHKTTMLMRDIKILQSIAAELHSQKETLHGDIDMHRKSNNQNARHVEKFLRACNDCLSQASSKLQEPTRSQIGKIKLQTRTLLDSIYHYFTGKNYFNTSFKMQNQVSLVQFFSKTESQANITHPTETRKKKI